MSVISGFVIIGVYQLVEGMFLPCSRSVMRFIFISVVRLVRLVVLAIDTSICIRAIGCENVN